MNNKVRLISFELSNMCNYAPIHPQCPLHNQIDNRKILELDIIEKVIDEAAAFEFKGTIQVNVYNEPLIDPRLYYILDKVRKTMLPTVRINIITNGYFLDQVILDELKNKFQVDVDVSGYNKKEIERLSKLSFDIGNYNISEAHLDNRLKTFYEANEIEGNNVPCYSPYIELIINCEGKVGLCCWEFKREITFGDLHHNSLMEILNGEKMINFYNDISRGIRTESICKKCYNCQAPCEIFSAGVIPGNFVCRYY